MYKNCSAGNVRNASEIRKCTFCTCEITSNSTDSTQPIYTSSNRVFVLNMDMAGIGDRHMRHCWLVQGANIYF